VDTGGCTCRLYVRCMWLGTSASECGRSFLFPLVRRFFLEHHKLLRLSYALAMTQAVGRSAVWNSRVITWDYGRIRHTNIIIQNISKIKIPNSNRLFLCRQLNILTHYLLTLDFPLAFALLLLSSLIFYRFNHCYICILI